MQFIRTWVRWGLKQEVLISYYLKIIIILIIILKISRPEKNEQLLLIMRMKLVHMNPLLKLNKIITLLQIWLHFNRILSLMNCLIVVIMKMIILVNRFIRIFHGLNFYQLINNYNNNHNNNNHFFLFQVRNRNQVHRQLLLSLKNKVFILLIFY